MLARAINLDALRSGCSHGAAALGGLRERISRTGQAAEYLHLTGGQIERGEHLPHPVRAGYHFDGAETTPFSTYPTCR